MRRPRRGLGDSRSFNCAFAHPAKEAGLKNTGERFAQDDAGEGWLASAQHFPRPNENTLQDLLAAGRDAQDSPWPRDLACFRDATEDVFSVYPRRAAAASLSSRQTALVVHNAFAHVFR